MLEKEHCMQQIFLKYHRYIRAVNESQYLICQALNNYWLTRGMALSPCSNKLYVTRIFPAMDMRYMRDDS